MKIGDRSPKNGREARRKNARTDHRSARAHGFRGAALDVVGRLVQPGLRDRAQTAEDAGEFGTLENGGAHREADLAVRGLHGHRLQVGVLKAILLGGAELPLTGVPVPNVLGVVGALPADLTDFSHDKSSVANAYYGRS